MLRGLEFLRNRVQNAREVPEQIGTDTEILRKQLLLQECSLLNPALLEDSPAKLQLTISWPIFMSLLAAAQPQTISQLALSIYKTLVSVESQIELAGLPDPEAQNQELYHGVSGERQIHVRVPTSGALSIASPETHPVCD